MTRIGPGFAPPLMVFDRARVDGQVGCECTKRPSGFFLSVYARGHRALISAKVKLVPDEAPIIAEDDSGTQYMLTIIRKRIFLGIQPTAGEASA